MIGADFEADIPGCLKALKDGGLILYPTDTIWGIGCDATNAGAVEKIFRLKNRPSQKAMVVLVADARDILHYTAAPDPSIFDYLETMTQPTTVIFEDALGLAENLTADDGSIAIRVCRDEFCRHLLKRFRNPLVSTSANLSGSPTPLNFRSIDPLIVNGVDYVVKYRQDDPRESTASRIVRWKDGEMIRLR
jgi:L-threonylcarbamoyladenylate synthase